LSVSDAVEHVKNIGPIALVASMTNDIATTFLDYFVSTFSNAQPLRMASL
jgi:hypothetical protein